MSKLKNNKINFNNSDFVVDVNPEFIISSKKIEEISSEISTTEDELCVHNAKKEAEEIIENAKLQAQNIIDNAKNEADEKREEIISNAKNEADEIIKNAKETSENESKELLDKSKEEIEKARTDSANQGYKEGYEDALGKLKEEMNEKIENLDNFCKSEFEIKDKILKSATNDILNIITNISKKIISKEINSKILDNIITQAIALLEQKENIRIIVSEKYAHLLYEIQKKNLGEDTELNFEEFNQYKNFEISYNPKFGDDTIIIENLKERFDASLSSQLDVIIRNIYDNSQNGKVDLDEYIENETERAE